MLRSTIATCLFVLLLAANATAGMPKVLVINSYHAEHPWVVSHNNALRSDLAGIAELTFFCMDTKRLHPVHHKERAEMAMEKYRTSHPDVVVLTDDNAMAFLSSEIMALGTPIVYLGINANPRSYTGTNTLMTGVLERPLLKRSIVFLKEILGDGMDKCMVLFDNGATARAAMETVFKGKTRLVFAKTATDINVVTTFAQWKALVRTAKETGYKAIILGLYHTIMDEEEKHVPAEMIARWTSVHSPVPVFGFWDFSVGKGMALGGLVLAGKPQGHEAAKLVKRILSGENPTQIQPVIAENGRFLFSRHELERWKITLPEELIRPTEPLEFIE